jgi:tetratricopeptide (TPR) repeat protein
MERVSSSSPSAKLARVIILCLVVALLALRTRALLMSLVANLGSVNLTATGYSPERAGEAERWFLLFVQLNPQSPQGLRNLGQALHLQGEYVASADVVEQAVEVDQTDVLAWYVLAEDHRALGNTEKGLIALARARAYTPLDTWARSLVGTAEVSVLESAMSDAVEADPTYAVTWRWLATASMYVRGDYALGAEASRRAVELDPGYRDGYEVLQSAYIGQGDYESALQVAEELERRWPGQGYLPKTRAAVHRLQGQFEEAAAEYLRDACDKRTCASSYFNAGSVWYGQERYEQARPYLEKAVVLHPDLTGYRVRLGDLYYHLGWMTGSQIEYTSALWLSPDQSYVVDMLKQLDRQ